MTEQTEPKKYDLVYIYKKQFEDIELRTSLRSLKNLKIGIGNIWFIGYLPPFVKNAKHIQVADSYIHKNQNAIKKILIACNNSEISEDFILMNDDFIFLKETKSIPNYARKSLKRTLEYYERRYGNNKYLYSMKNTLKIVGDEAIDYEIHYPIMINKKKFIDTFRNIPWRRKPYVHRSIYANLNKLEPTYTKDFKVYSLLQLTRLKYSHFISLDNRVAITRQFKLFVKQNFRLKSPYEK
jgi:hypothetical protein